jgi:hypothetical protein
MQTRPGPTARFQFFSLIIATALSLACSASREQPGKPSASAIASPQTTPILSASPANNPVGATPPPISEVQEAVKRISVDAIAIDTSQNPPIVGDFNGDDSEDLAVVVRPLKGALSKVNSEYANWILEDPRKVVLPDPDKAVQRLPKPGPPVVVQADDVLLLVLHGYKETGWHHQFARQTFLLRNAVGENLRAQTVSEVSKVSGDRNLSPQRLGNVISEKLSGRDGYLFWSNGRYVWHE